MNKKFLTVGLAGALAVTAVVGGSLAYFTDTDQKDNTFTVGNVKIELTEPSWEGEVQNVYPGEALDKDPTVKNIGASPCFVRIDVEGLGCLGDGNEITYSTDDPGKSLNDGWELYDGYIYYTSVLDADAITTPAFDQIHIPTTVTNGDGSKMNVIVTAEAVQSQGAEEAGVDVEDMTVDQIAAWFGTCGMND